jgi:starvation-inducible outer membrane lipoprotein
MAKLLAFLVMVSFILNLSGCATIPTAIEYSDLQVKVKMTDTIFLDPILKAKHKKVFLSVANTSDLQEIDPTVLKNALPKNLSKRATSL